MRILLVEDDQITGLALVDSLTAQQYVVNLANDGETGLQLAQEFSYDLVLLDIVLPKLDGISVCQRLRGQGYEGPILLLTAKDSSSDRVLGLDAGADDYVVKPFDLPELLARIRALLRRNKNGGSTIITWENIRFDPAHSEVTCHGKPIHLTPKEYCVLELLLFNPKRIFSRSAILDRLWDFAESPGEETVSSHIYSLRQKLKAAGSADMIETVHGLGYRLRAPSRSSEPEPVASSDLEPPLAAAMPRRDRQQAAVARTAKLWEKFKPKLITQILDLEVAVNGLQLHPPVPDCQQVAEQTAHKLVGSLGLFGWTEGSRMARQLEKLLQQPETLKSEEIDWAIARIQLIRQGIDHVTVDDVVLSPAIATPLPYSPLILVVDDDLLLAEQLRLEATLLGMRVEVATDLAVARVMIAKTPPDAILLDLNFPHSTEDGLSLLKELANCLPRIPVLVFTVRESLGDRVQALRLGARAFLHKPLLTHQIFQAIIEVLQHHHHLSGHRVIAVNDDAIALSKLAASLSSWNVETTTVENPKNFWQVLTTVVPDLLILEWNLSTISGLDLCQVVRHDPQWRDLPILVMTDRTDLASIQQVFAAGASDFIAKPVVEAELVMRIVSRLEGSRSSLN